MSTGLKQIIQMTKSPLTRHGIILLQTPMIETLSRHSSLFWNTSWPTSPQKPNHWQYLLKLIIALFTGSNRFDGKMSIISRFDALSKGLPQIVAWEQCPHNRPFQPWFCRMSRAKRALVTIFLSKSTSKPIRRHLALLTGNGHTLHGTDAPHNELNCVSLARAAQNDRLVRWSNARGVLI
jgi:hypothetical protein